MESAKRKDKKILVSVRSVQAITNLYKTLNYYIFFNLFWIGYE